MCSSPTIGNQNEVLVLRQLVNLLHKSGILDSYHLIIRTHPLLDIDSNVIDDLQPFNVSFYPRIRTSPNFSSKANLMYLSTIQYSECVVGLNTSAFLDCCIMDRPCVTLPSIRGLYDSTKFGHINLLLKGNFISRPESLPDVISLLLNILDNNGDNKYTQRSEFARDFLHPFRELPSKLIYQDILDQIK
jgi:hypothetical protein